MSLESDTPHTTAILKTSPLLSLPTIEEQISERLIVLAHLSYNPDVWGTRLERYWPAFRENVQGSANTNKIDIWWGNLAKGMGLKDLTNQEFLHELNVLMQPES